MLEKLTLNNFSKHINGTFRIRLDSIEKDSYPETISMQIMEVSPLGSTEKREEQRQSFSVLFLGPAEPILPQQIYTLEHDEMGSLPLFLVPLGPRDKGIIYEAIFT